MVEAGANRIGTSSGVSILREAAQPDLAGAGAPAARPDSY
jgi:hypothetical protein